MGRYYTALIAVLIFVNVFLLINNLYFEAIMPQRLIVRKEAQFEQCKYDAKILFMGDSYPDSAVMPQYIPQSFNWAMSSEPYFQTYLKLKKALSEDNNISVVVLPLNLNSFSSYKRDMYIYSWYLSQFVSYRELSDWTGRNVVSVMVEDLFPIVGNGVDFKRIASEVNPVEMFRGWHSLHAAKKYSPKDTKVLTETVKLQFVEQIVVDPDFMDVFRKTIDLAVKENKTVVLVKYPTTPDYSDAVKSLNISQDDFFEAVESELADYPVIILDYRGFVDDYDLFADPVHLNKWGAEIFSKKLAHDLDLLLNHDDEKQLQFFLYIQVSKDF